VAVLDTSWLVALFSPSDAHHAKAVAQSRTATDLKLPAACLVEFLQVVFYRVRSSAGETAAHVAARQAHDDLRALPAIEQVPDLDPSRSAQLYARHPRLSYVDAVGLSTALRLRQPILGFDVAQQSALRKEN
jgi:predicted nucleic acid-binding protein